MSNSFIWPIDSTLSRATIMDQSESRNDSDEDLLRIPQSSSITGDSPSDCLVSYQGHSLSEEFYFSAEMQSVYSTFPTDWVFSYCWDSLSKTLFIFYLLDVVHPLIFLKCPQHQASYRKFGNERVFHHPNWLLSLRLIFATQDRLREKLLQE